MEYIRLNNGVEIFDFKLADDEIHVLETLDQRTAFVGNPNNPELVELSLSW